MAEIDVTVCGRTHRLACEDGQESRLATLAVRLDAEARALSASTGALSEPVILLMTALVMADRADEAAAALARAEAGLREAAASADAAPPAQHAAEADAAVAAALAPALSRLEALLAQGSPA